MDANCMVLGIGLVIFALIAMFFAIQYFEARDVAKREKSRAELSDLAYKNLKLTVGFPDEYQVGHITAAKSFIVFASRTNGGILLDCATIKEYKYSNDEERDIAQNLAEELAEKLSETV